MQLGFVGSARWAATWSIASTATRTTRSSPSTSTRARARRRPATARPRSARSRSSSRTSTRRARSGSWSPPATRPGHRRPLAELLDEGDTIIDGGNSKWTDDKLRAEELSPKGINYVDVGTSGGVWGLEVGYCMMVGGPDEAVERLSPILDVLAPPSTEEHGPGGSTSARPAPATT
jgi:hypothetical protein